MFCFPLVLQAGIARNMATCALGSQRLSRYNSPPMPHWTLMWESALGYTWEQRDPIDSLVLVISLRISRVNFARIYLSLWEGPERVISLASLTGAGICWALKGCLSHSLCPGSVKIPVEELISLLKITVSPLCKSFCPKEIAQVFLLFMSHYLNANHHFLLRTWLWNPDFWSQVNETVCHNINWSKSHVEKQRPHVLFLSYLEVNTTNNYMCVCMQREEDRVKEREI